MSIRITLIGMPALDISTWSEDLPDDTLELHANNLPLFWLALFNEDDIQMRAETCENDDGTGAPFKYPFLGVSVQTGVSRAKARRIKLLNTLGSEYAALYDAFLDYIQKTTSPYIVMDTFDMAQASEDMDSLIEELRKQVSSFEIEPLWPGYLEFIPEQPKPVQEVMLAGQSDDFPPNAHWHHPVWQTTDESAAPKPGFLARQWSNRTDHALSLLFAAMVLGLMWSTGSLIFAIIGGIAAMTGIIIWREKRK
ncbi:hypothetical protein [Roseobacter sp. CCS2]|uniref:hypothetical protein n=1 Tax=Roseobacter sp. CCS2 TaxID=391593 RepID=UPI0000F3F0A7|nr:hypothetical protein [Roseobacter sp. CCS2]EBA11184.1 hypothetical protein RCCS2_10445 [Roseobacter sp. CCS2]